MNRRYIAAAGAAVAALSIGGVVGVNTLTAANCASVAPGGSLNAAYQASDPGCVISLPTGSWGAQTLYVDPDKPGTSDIENVVFQPASGANPVFTSTLALGEADGSPAGASHVTFRNLKIGLPVTRPGSVDSVWENIDAGNVLFSGGHQVVLRNSDVGPAVDTVFHIKQGSQDVLVQDTVIHDYVNTTAEEHMECVQISDGVQRITFIRVSLLDCTDFGAFYKAPGSSAISIIDSRIDSPMPGNVATITCNPPPYTAPPTCVRGGPSVRFSTYAYPGSKIADSCLGSSLSIDPIAQSSITVTNTRINAGNCTGYPAGSPPDPTETTTTTETTDTTTTTETTTPPPSTYNFGAEFDRLEATSYYGRYERANPGEAARVETYWRSGGARPAVATSFGLFLVKAAEEIRR